MRLSLRLAAVAAFALSAFVSLSSRADTYQVSNLGTDERGKYALDAYGRVAVEVYDSTCGPTGICYANIFDTSLVNTFSPAFAVDDGTPCKVAISPVLIYSQFEVCNNGRVAAVAFNSTLDPNIYIKAFLYPDAQNPSVILPASASVSFLYMNARGDILYNDAASEELYLAIEHHSERPRSHRRVGAEQRQSCRKAECAGAVDSRVH